MVNTFYVNLASEFTSIVESNPVVENSTLASEETEPNNGCTDWFGGCRPVVNLNKEFVRHKLYYIELKILIFPLWVTVALKTAISFPVNFFCNNLKAN